MVSGLRNRGSSRSSSKSPPRKFEGSLLSLLLRLEAHEQSVFPFALILEGAIAHRLVEHEQYGDSQLVVQSSGKIGRRSGGAVTAIISRAPIKDGNGVYLV